MSKKHLTKPLVFLLAFLMVLAPLSPAVYAVEGTEETPSAGQNQSTKLEKIRELLDSNTYEEYRLLHENAPKGTDFVVLKGEDYDPENTTAEVVKKDVDPSVSGALCVPDSGDVSWKFNLSSTGLYHIAITYVPIVELDADGGKE